MKRTTAILTIGGGIAAAVGAWLASRKSAATQATIANAVAGTDPPMSAPPSVGSGGLVSLRLTGYWPFSATADEKQMEGGLKDRKGAPLHTVEDFFAGKSDFVSLSGDDAIWPYGQKVIIPWGDRTITGRVVDTGSHFRGAGKLYRVMGSEPIDVCVFSSKTVIPKVVVTAQIISGDNQAKSGLTAVATSKFKDQTVTAGDVIGDGLVEGRTTDDHEALARALESELSGCSDNEMIAAAWAMRNRADVLGLSLTDLLAPRGMFGAPHRSGGYASTRRVPTNRARALSAAVLGADESADSTGGAVDFWVPVQQEKLRQLGDVYRAAAKSGDMSRASKYARYRGYGTEMDVRTQQAQNGLHVIGSVGIVELLGKI